MYAPLLATGVRICFFSLPSSHSTPTAYRSAAYSSVAISSTAHAHAQARMDVVLIHVADALCNLCLEEHHRPLIVQQGGVHGLGHLAAECRDKDVLEFVAVSLIGLVLDEASSSGMHVHVHVHVRMRLCGLCSLCVCLSLCLPPTHPHTPFLSLSLFRLLSVTC